MLRDRADVFFSNVVAVIDRIHVELRRHRGGAPVGHLVAMHAQAHAVQARRVEIPARLLRREESGLAKRVGVDGAMRGRCRNDLVDEVIDKPRLTLDLELGRQRVSAEKGCHQARNVGIRLVPRDDVEQRGFAGLMQRVPRFGFERRRAVRDSIACSLGRIVRS